MELSNPNGLLQPLYQKIRQLGREVRLQEAPLAANHSPHGLGAAALALIESIREHLQPLLQLPEEYQKLEAVVQKHQHDIRKHIGVEQQLKLYGDSLQQQVEESEKCRKSLLEQTRKMLVALKRENQKLYAENNELRQQLRKLEGSVVRPKRDNSSAKKQHVRNRSIEDSERPLKTEYQEKKTTIEKTSPGSNRKHNQSVASQRQKNSKKPGGMKPSRERSTSRKALPTKPQEKQLKLKTQKRMANEAGFRASANQSRTDKNRPRPKAQERLSAEGDRHFQSHQQPTRSQL